MKKRMKRIFTVFLVCTLVLSMMPCHLFEGGSVQAAETVLASGSCGTNLTWTITEDTEVDWDLVNETPYKLTIEGTGSMDSYSYSSRAPWYFYYGTISTVAIGEGVTSIGDYAFYEHSSLKVLELPETLKIIGAHSFTKCNSLISFVVPDSVTTIGDFAFWATVSLESVTMGANVDSIGYAAFEACSQLSAVVLNDKLTTIGQQAFSDTALESIELPESLITIEDIAFQNTDLLSLHIPKNVTSIGCGVVESALRLTEITVDEENTTFKVIDSLLYEMKDGKPYRVLAYPYELETSEITIAEGTEVIDTSTFTDAYFLKHIHLPNTVKVIGRAFEDSSITEITIPDSVEVLWSGCFTNCSNLKKVSIGAGLNEYAKSVVPSLKHVFSGCTSLETIICSEANTTLEVVDNVLYSEDLTTLYLYPAGRKDEVFRVLDSVTTLGCQSIYKVGSLKELYLSKEITKLDYNAINNNKNLASIYFYGNAPTSYGNSIAQNAENLIIYKTADATDFTTSTWTSHTLAEWDPMNELVIEGTFGDVSWKFEGSMGRVTLTGVGKMPDFTLEEPAPWAEYMSYIQTIEAEGLTGVGDYAFYQADKLLRMQNEGATTEIGAYAFTDCGKLFSMDIKDAIFIGRSAFRNCTSLREAELSPRLTTLSEEVFAGCSAITRFMLPKNLTTIETAALRDCSSVRTLNIPASVTTISSNAIAGGTILEKVYFYGAMPETFAQDSFSNGNENLTIYYRSSYKDWEELDGIWNGIFVQGLEKFYSENEDYYSFDNCAESFGYDETYRIPRQRYVDVLNSIHYGTYWYALNKLWYGSCYGMTGTTLAFYENPDLRIADYDATARNLYQVSAPQDKNADLTKLIEGYQVSQYHTSHISEIYENYKQYEDLVWRIEEFERSGGLSVDSQATPVVIIVYSIWGAHAVVPLSIEKNENGDFVVPVYDCNYPEELQTLYISKDYQKMAYTAWDYALSFVDYTTIAESMSGVTLYTEPETPMLYVSIDKQDGNVVNSEGKGIDEIDGAYEQKHFASTVQDTFLGIRSFILPQGDYILSAVSDNCVTDESISDNTISDNKTEEKEKSTDSVTFYMASTKTFAQVTTTDKSANLEISQTEDEDHELMLKLVPNAEAEGEVVTEERTTCVTLMNASGMQRNLVVSGNEVTVNITKDDAISVEVPDHRAVTLDGTKLSMTDGKADISFVASESENPFKVEDLKTQITCSETNSISGNVVATVLSNATEGKEAVITVSYIDKENRVVASYSKEEQIHTGLNEVSLQFKELETMFTSKEVEEELLCRLTVTEAADTSKGASMEEIPCVVHKNTVVTFDTDGGSFEIQHVTYDGYVNEPEETPIKAQHTFKFWSLDGSIPYDFASKVTLTEMKLIAVWEAITYCVTFDTNGGTEVESQRVLSGEKVVEPTEPTKEGYTFVGWFENEGDDVFDFENITITKDTVLTARWEKVADTEQGGDPDTKPDETPDTEQGGTTDTTPDTEQDGTEDKEPDETPDTEQGETPDANPDETPDTEQGGTSDTKPDETPDTEQGETPDANPDETPDTEQGGTSETKPDETPDTEQGGTPETKPDETPDTEQGGTPEIKPDETPDTEQGETPDAKPDETPDTEQGGTSETKPDETPDTEQGGTPETTPDETPDIEPEQTPNTETDKTPTTGEENSNTDTQVKEDTSAEAVKVSDLRFKEKTFKIAAGKKVVPGYSIIPQNATTKTLEWKSSNTKWATVKNGVVTTKKAGKGKTVTITAYATDGSGVKASVKILIMKHAVKKVSLKAVSKTVKAGKKVKVKAIVKTTGKKVNKTLCWKSSNTKWATVKNGIVTTKKAGKGHKVTITAISTDGTNKKAKVTIKIQ